MNTALYEKNNIIRDLGIIILSIVVAIIIAKTGVLANILTSTQEMEILGSLIAGMFFVSIFTAAPAGVVLFEIAAANSIWEVALFGGIGALAGDLLIFRFIRDSLSEDIHWLIRKTKQERFFSIFRLKMFRWIAPFIGALIVASPLPDEVGLAMMGLFKMKMLVFVPISFSLNFLGILIIGLFAKGML
ncbi:hypothetical protein HYT00_02855 [Candidatus Giovannonibacteria bacterium]|nr:hypothetical protein [Candidatus Giovannonibacteria bacterium]